MSDRKQNIIKYKFPSTTEPLTLRHKTDFYSVSPNYWDSSGMKMSNDSKIIYGTIPNTNIHTVLKGTGFYVEENRYNDSEVNSFIDTTLNKFPVSKQDRYENIFQKGESETVEFKATFKWDINENRVNKELPEKVTQAVCAFSNSRGGKLFIGIKDDKSIYGLKNDLKKIFKSVDKFQQEVAKKIRVDLGGGIDYKMDIEEIHSKQICVVEVETSDVPVFFKNKEYYVRRGSSNHNCNAKETYEHIINHYRIFQEINSAFYEDEDEDEREIQVDTELINNYIDMLNNDEIPPLRIFRTYKVIRDECISISLKHDLNNDILDSVRKIYKFFCYKLNDINKELSELILQSLYYTAKREEILEILKKICYKHLINLFEQGERSFYLIFVLFECGYYSDIIKTILNAYDARDLSFLREISRILKSSTIQSYRIELLKILNKKIVIFISQKDDELIEVTNRLIERLEVR